MIKRNSIFKLTCTVFILCIFLSRIASAGTTFVQRSTNDKTPVKASIIAEAADSDDETESTPIEFKDFLIGGHHPDVDFHADIIQLVKALNLTLPITHLSIPIQPPR
ncbi:MAG: hypothetical protein EOO88_02590 [Pedobacter sp.]|nr:MAG: hypothetical protein EOO88_02590 [Pedobacter sp.]